MAARRNAQTAADGTPPPVGPDVKPVVDAINDAVGALSELVRSFRATARASAKHGRRQAHGFRADAEEIVKDRAKQAQDELVRGGQALREGIERAWDTIRYGGPKASNGRGARAKSGAKRKKRSPR